jgi:hypothetical protein
MLCYGPGVIRSGEKSFIKVYSDSGYLGLPSGWESAPFYSSQRPRSMTINLGNPWMVLCVEVLPKYARRLPVIGVMQNTNQAGIKLESTKQKHA